MRALLLAALLAIGAQAARSLPPPPKHYVLDEPNALSATSRAAIDRLLSEHDIATGEQFVVAIFDSLGDEDLVQWTNQVFANWKIGKRGKDNGVLLALYWKERKIRFEVGYGLEPVLTDALAKRIIEESLVPELRAQSPDRAVALAAMRVLRALESPLLENGKAEEILRGGSFSPSRAVGAPGARGSWAVLVLLGLGALMIAFYFLTAAEAHYTSGGWYHPKPWRRRRGPWGGFGGGGGLGGFGGGGFGGFGGGGGRSGGGGASGSW